MKLSCSQVSMVIVAGVICFAMITGVECWSDDDEILKWNPTWLSNFRYAKPIGIRQRGNLYKRLSDSDAKRLPPLYFPPPPFELKRSSIQDISRELQIPMNRKKLLGWYSGPGSAYHVESSEVPDLPDVVEKR